MISLIRYFLGIKEKDYDSIEAPPSEDYIGSVNQMLTDEEKMFAEARVGQPLKGKRFLDDVFETVAMNEILEGGNILRSID